MDEEHRYRLVVLGAGRTGKTSIIQRFLNSRFPSVYRPTVEDLHCRNFTVNGTDMKVDILDTAGNLAFPAMRRLSISTAHAFLLVFSIDDRDSFEEVKQLWDQIVDQRSNYRDLPCVVAANKADLATEETAAAAAGGPRSTVMDEAATWSRSRGIAGALVEVSAKNNENISTIFRTLLRQATAASSPSAAGDAGGQSAATGTRGESSSSSSTLKRHCSANAARLSPHAPRLRGDRDDDAASLSRSRSLMRRPKKSKVKDRSVSPNPTADSDCSIC